MEMSFEVEHNSVVDQERLKFITVQVYARQGLTFVLIGSMLLLFDMGRIYDPPGWAFLLIAPAYFVALKFYIKLIDRLPEYYERRFGKVEPKSSGNVLLQTGMFIVFFVVLFVWHSKLNTWDSELERWIHQTVPTATGIFPLLLWIGALIHSLGKRIRFDPYGAWFCLLGTFATCALAFCPIWWPSVAGTLLWKSLSAGWLGLTLITMGLYNHYLLVRLMPKQAGDDDDEC